MRLPRRANDAMLERIAAYWQSQLVFVAAKLGVADVLAYPFLKYAVIWEDGDEHEFHRVLQRWLPIDGHPRVEAWIHRVDGHPRA